MTHLELDLRKKFKISGLCQVLRGSVRPHAEEGVELHFVHHATSSATFIPDGTLDPKSLGRLAISAEFGRETGISRLLEDERGARPYRAPLETLTLSIPLSGGSAPRRTALMVEVAERLHEVMFAGTCLPMVTVTREVKQGRHCVIRHHLVAIFDDYRRPYWVHPALSRFGLAKIPIPPHQTQRDLGPIPGWMDPPDSEVFDLDQQGFPLWYNFSLELEGRRPVDAEKVFWKGAIGRKIPDIVRIAAHSMLANFEAFFGYGTLIPARRQGRW